jgi:tagaturonate reductase
LFGPAVHEAVVRIPAPWEVGVAPRGLAFSLAALLWFYRGSKQEGCYVGHRAAGDYPIRDDGSVIEIMAKAWSAAGSREAGAVALTLLADAALWGEDLTKLGDLAAQAAEGVAAIEKLGLRGALEKLKAGALEHT